MKIGYDYGRLVTGKKQQIELIEEAETTDVDEVVPDPLGREQWWQHQLRYLLIFFVSDCSNTFYGT